MALKKDHAEREYSISEGNTINGDELDIMLWLMFESDGASSILDIAEKTGFSIRQLYEAAEQLTQHGLLEEMHGQREHQT